MATEFVTIQGKLSWVKVHQPNQWDKWTVTIHPNAEGLEKIRKLQAEGLKNVLNHDEDGWKVTFNRPIYIKRRDGSTTPMRPPELLGPDGIPMDSKLVGNGSDGTVKLEVYQHRVPLSDKKAKAARLLAIKIDNLIPYEIPRDGDDFQKRAVKGLDEVTPQPKF